MRQYNIYTALHYNQSRSFPYTTFINQDYRPSRQLSTNRTRNRRWVASGYDGLPRKKVRIRPLCVVVSLLGRSHRVEPSLVIRCEIPSQSALCRDVRGVSSVLPCRHQSLRMIWACSSEPSILTRRQTKKPWPGVVSDVCSGSWRGHADRRLIRENGAHAVREFCPGLQL